jgi:hypothetical protein
MRMSFHINYLLITTLMACSVGTRIGDSSLTGDSIDVLKAQRATAQPLYDELTSTGEGNEKVLRVGIFLTYDHDPSMRGGGPVDPNDLSIQAYKVLRNYFAGDTTKGGVFLPASGSPKILSETPNAVVFRGKGVALNNGKNPITWEVSLAVGTIAEMTRIAGTAMASYHITMLNGHFYSGTLPGSQASMMTFDSLQTMVYGPAMDAFQAAKERSKMDLPYRIVVFNGCGSELIENYVLSRYGAGKVDIVGQRGVSNYRYFNQQIIKFILALVNGQKWTETLQSLTFVPPRDPQVESVSPEFTKVTPVLRSRY